ncbi:phosphoribosylformylglycinamidine cyclo-ligase, partial [mine drainage metagenome]
LDPEEVAAAVLGVARACREIGAALLGGETAELPDLFAPGEFDLVGFGVGAVEEERKISSHAACEGDILIGLGSSGFHSNGFSLVRRIIREQNIDLTQEYGLGEPLSALLLRPTMLYGPMLSEELGAGRIRALSHITGGGIPGNVPRMLAAGTGARLDQTAWEVPGVMAW